MADVTGAKEFDTGVAARKALLPGQPNTWSYSSLKEVETCPRRYALSRADYPELWDRHGYPRTPHLARIKGDVVHSALEIILKALVKAECLSTRSAKAVTVLREIGGYTKVASDALTAQLMRFDDNPRVSTDRREQLTRALSDWVPEAREYIQTYLNRLELRVGPETPDLAPNPASEQGKRYPVSEGDHLEKQLVADALRLGGRVDLLAVDPDGARITDFKTGAEDPAHHDQLRLYALLWADDNVVNPRGLPVTALVASYPSHEVAVPVPGPDELAKLRRDVAARIDTADTAATGNPPETVVGEYCGICDVRGLCDTYWITRVPRTADVADGEWYDLSGTVLREHGVKSWVVREAHTGHEVLVRTPPLLDALPLDHDVRILGVRRVVDRDKEEALVASLTRASEVLRLTK